MLESNDKADVLAALTFLGGRHFNEPGRASFGGPTESQDAWAFQQLMDSARIRELVERLTNSEDEWIRQAALLAARGPRDRPLN